MVEKFLLPRAALHQAGATKLGTGEAKLLKEQPQDECRLRGEWKSIVEKGRIW